MSDQHIERRAGTDGELASGQLMPHEPPDEQGLSLGTNRGELRRFNFPNSVDTVYVEGELIPIESFLLELSTNEMRAVLGQAIKNQEMICPGDGGERPLDAFMQKYFESSSTLLPAKGIDKVICEELRLSEVILKETCQESSHTRAVTIQNRESKIDHNLPEEASLVELRIERMLRENLPAWKEQIALFAKSLGTELNLKFSDRFDLNDLAMLGSPEKAFAEYVFNGNSLKQVASYLLPVIGWTKAIGDYIDGTLEILKPVESSVQSPALRELRNYTQSLGLSLKFIPIKKEGLYSVAICCMRPVA